MNKLMINVSKLSAFAFAGLVAGCLTDRRITAEVRGEKNGKVVIVVWRGAKHCYWLVNMVTKEIECSGLPIHPSVVEMLLDQNSNNDELTKMIWGDDAPKQVGSAA